MSINNRLNYPIIISCLVVLLFFGLKYACTQEQYKYEASGQRNPFVPVISPDGRIIQLESEGKKDDVSLEGIIYDNKGLSYAIVNGQVIKVGDALGESRVLKIEKNKVVFIKDGQITEVVLKEDK